MTPAPGPSALPEPAPEPPAGYLDAVAGQPLLPAARQAWSAAADRAWSDPARLHHPGRVAGAILDAARASLADALGVRPAELYLASSGPTAVAIALQGLLANSRSRRVVASAVESLAVTSAAEDLTDDVACVPVSDTGRVDVAALADTLASPAAVACVQLANAEVGTCQPLAEAHGLARAAGVPLLAHAVQVVGRRGVGADWDLLAASARDWGGPAGVGVLVVRESVPWRPTVNERGWLGGFPDIPGAAAAATALEYLAPVIDEEAQRAWGLIDRLRAELPRLDEAITVVGDPVDRLPHLLTFTCAGVTGEALVGELGRRGLSVASGSACTSDARMPSQVLAAMGVRADASIRVALPFGCAPASLDALLAELPASLAAVRA